MLQDTNKLPNADLVDQFQLQDSDDGNHGNPAVPAFRIPYIVIWVPGNFAGVQVDQVLIPDCFKNPGEAMPKAYEPELGFG